MDAIQPASLSFLSIYNPSLGESDETVADQIVYYYASKTSRYRTSLSGDEEERKREEGHERLRQVGLAQGMVNFAKAFSDGEPVDSVEAEKSRILLHELEPGWWLVASVDLTRLQHPSTASKTNKGSASDEPTIEYSSREVSPQDLLLQQLLRAHSIFLLHQAPSLSDLWVRISRQKFCNALERFWNRFVRDWDVLLHGGPAVDIFNGLKLAAGGELGIGVGEEEWGSGEREVLEGFIDRTDGLADIIVSKFGSAEDTPSYSHKDHTSKTPWLGSGAMPGSSDGVIFSGIGNLTRTCLRNVSAWMELIYRYGTAAYGVHDNPSAPRRKRRRRSPRENSQTKQSREPATSPREELPPGVPPPIARAVDQSLETATQKADAASSADVSGSPSTSDTMLKYMTLGIYGSNWGLQSARPSAPDSQTASEQSRSELYRPLRHLDPRPDEPSSENDVENGCFLVGLQGSLEDITASESEDDISTDQNTGGSREPGSNRRIQVRTLYIELNYPSPSPPGSPPRLSGADPTHHARLRVVVYVRRPFIFAFLFHQNTPTLSLNALYRSLHHQLGPLQKPLLSSTSFETAQSRMLDATSNPKTVSPLAENTLESPIFDLIWDPHTMSVHSTIPFIPEPGTLAAEGLDSSTSEMSRIDALNFHTQILLIIKETRRRPAELERTVKTSRGWWVVWMRLLPEKAITFIEAGEGDVTDEEWEEAAERQQVEDQRARRGEIKYREAILVRRAGDHPKSAQAKKGWMGGAPKESAWGSAGRVVEGIGVDARRYVEGLLNLNR